MINKILFIIITLKQNRMIETRERTVRAKQKASIGVRRWAGLSQLLSRAETIEVMEHLELRFANHLSLAESQHPLHCLQ